MPAFPNPCRNTWRPPLLSNKNAKAICSGCAKLEPVLPSKSTSRHASHIAAAVFSFACGHSRREKSVENGGSCHGDELNDVNLLTANFMSSTSMSSIDSETTDLPPLSSSESSTSMSSIDGTDLISGRGDSETEDLPDLSSSDSSTCNSISETIYLGSCGNSHTLKPTLIESNAAFQDPCDAYLQDEDFLMEKLRYNARIESGSHILCIGTLGTLGKLFLC